MWVTILPFFLVANVIIDDSHHRPEWTMYGPEYTFNVLLNMSVALITNISSEYSREYSSDRVCEMVASELKCRPRGQDTLNCYFQNARLDFPKKKSKYECKYTDKPIYGTQLFVGDERFEIRFNERGIENLIVPKTIPRDKLDVIKAVVNQLDIGFDVNERRKNFKITENWKDSICQYNVKITHDTLESEENDDDPTGGERFDLAFSSSNNDRHEPFKEMYRVEKMRQITNCPRINFLVNFLDYKSEDQLDMSRTTSTSHITISNKDFVSSTTIDDALWTSKSKSLIMRPSQNINIKLKRIDFARTPLPEIKDPVSTSKVIFSNLKTI